MSTNENPDILRFWDAIKSTMSAYIEPSFSYLAIKHGEDFVIVQGVIFLNLIPGRIPFSHYQTDNIKAGHYKLTELKLTIEEAISALLAGTVPTPSGPLLFTPPEGGLHHTYFNPFHPVGLQEQNRLTALSLAGAPLSQFIRQPHLDWELKAAPVPYDNIHELMSEYLLGGLNTSGQINIEVAALNIAAIDRTTSKVEGTKAKLGVLLSKGLDPKQVRLGWRVLNQQKVHERNSVEGEKLNWIETDDSLTGTIEIDIPQGAAINASVSYAGTTQHYYWLIDQSAWQNSYRASYETFDKELAHLKDLISTAGKGVDARNLEHAVQCILWMLGFSVLHLAKISDAPDLIAATPRGNLAVVECTTGLLNANSKLSKLYDRSELIRKNLLASGRSDLKLLPVIVTTKPKKEVEHEMVEAEKIGISVVTAEDLQEVINNTLIAPNAERIYEQAEQEAQEKKAKHQAQTNLNLEK